MICICQTKYLYSTSTDRSSLLFKQSDRSALSFGVSVKTVANNAYMSSLWGPVRARMSACRAAEDSTLPLRIAEQVLSNENLLFSRLFLTKLDIAPLSVRLGRAQRNAIRPMLYTSKRSAGLKISSRFSGAAYTGSQVASLRPFLKGELQSHEEPKSMALSGAPSGSPETTSRFSGLTSLEDKSGKR